MRAIEAVTADPALHTGDLGGKSSTAEYTSAIIAASTVQLSCVWNRPRW